MRLSLFLVFALLLSSLTTVRAEVLQEITVSGTVTDDAGVPMPGVNITVKGTATGTISDVDGKYAVGVPGKNAVLVFSFIGFATQEIPVGNQTQLNVSMSEDARQIEEVVVVGYGTQTRREITGSVASVNEESFNKGLVRDAADLLQGKVAGLVITSGSGDVTRGSQIRLRGTSTLQNDQGPFIVIDGIPGGDLSTVAPQDIESISVLKDASSAAIYGSRAAGGVILVTTKRGAGAKPQITYNGYLSIDQMRNKPDMMNADQWREYARSVDTSAKDMETYDLGADTDWFEEITRTGISHNHSLSLAGGASKSNYRASFTYLNRKGISRDNDMERMNFRFQFQQRAMNDKLRIGLTGSATLGDMNFPNRDNFMLAYNMLPTYPVYNADGSYFTRQNNEFDQGNPVQNQDLNIHNSENLYFYGVGDIQYTIIDGLNIKANLYKSRNSRAVNKFNHSETKPGMNDKGFAEKSSSIMNREMMEFMLDYEKTFGVHKVSGIVGYSWEHSKREEHMGRNRNFLMDDLTYNNLESGIGLTNGDVTSEARSEKLISGFARAHYSFDERYMITATVRRDGSSKFGANHKWGIFPSASVAWGISQEKFMAPTKSWLDDMKIRAGYGVTGNQDGLQPYNSLETYGTAGIYYDNGSWYSAYSINRNPNPNLKWESTAMLNVGIDFALFNNRVSGTIEYYDKKTSDMLYRYTVPTPPFVYNEMQANVGDMSNKGIEFLLNVAVIRNKDFSWNLSFNASHNKNEITRLSDEIYSTSRVYVGDPWIRGNSNVTSHVVEEGRPVGQFFMLKCNGIDADGKYIMEDVSGDGQINEDDRTYVGDAQPDLTFGLNNSFAWKQWDLSFFFRGSLGQKALNTPRAAFARKDYLIGANAMDDPLVYQLKESGRICSYYLEDASFVKLDNMALGYTLNLKKNNYVEKARFYVAAQNLLVITGYKGLDPEMELYRGDTPTDKNAGLDPGIEPRQFLPRARTFTFGVNLTF
jgi:iron complex outermembrane receptor protein